MGDPGPSSSEIEPGPEGPPEGGASSSQDLFITHQVSKLDTLPGLAIRYNVTVSDIKRANGLLSDSGMFAKETLLIPTRSMPLGLEYSTWAGMIVTQFGRIPGDRARALPGFPGGSPPKQSAALDMLQQYYGTAAGDTASEPSDFRPGEREGTEIELSNLGPPPPGSVEYAGDRAVAGAAADEPLRRRRPGELSADCSPAREREAAGPEPGGGRAVGGGSWQHRRSNTQPSLGGGGGGAPPQRSESLLERLKRVASQPALALPPTPSLARIGEAVISPLADALPPLPPGGRARERSGSFVSPRPRPSKEGHKGD